MYIVEAQPTPLFHENGYFIAGEYRNVERSRLALAEIALGVTGQSLAADQTRNLVSHMRSQIGKIAFGFPIDTLPDIRDLLKNADVYLENRGNQYTMHAAEGGMSGVELGHRLAELETYEGMFTHLQPLTHQGSWAKISGESFEQAPLPLAGDEPMKDTFPGATHFLTSAPLRFGTDGLPRIEGRPERIPGLVTASGTFEALSYDEAA